MLLAVCPACRGVCVIHPGDPPGTGHNYYNRCVNAALTGRRGKGGEDTSWSALSCRKPQRGSGLCGFPLTTADGTPIPPLPFDTFRRITSRVTFDVAELWDAALPGASDWLRIFGP